jgi:formylmethanofuran dehydrogenase subunit E
MPLECDACGSVIGFYEEDKLDGDARICCPVCADKLFARGDI